HEFDLDVAPLPSLNADSSTFIPHPGWLFSVVINDTATTEIYTLSLHDALPIYLDVILAHRLRDVHRCRSAGARHHALERQRCGRDRKSTRLNSSHVKISYAVFCLKKKNSSNYNHLTEYKLRIPHPPS